MTEPITVRLLDLFRIGLGPSSSHTVGPMRAARYFRRRCLKRAITPARVVVLLKGSLSATGRGHLTDQAVLAGLHGWKPETCDIDAVHALPENLAQDPSVAWGDGATRVRPDDVRFLRFADYRDEGFTKRSTRTTRCSARRRGARSAAASSAAPSR